MTSEQKNYLIAFLCLTTLAGAAIAVKQHRRIGELSQQAAKIQVVTKTDDTAGKAYLNNAVASVEKPKEEAPVEDTQADQPPEDNNRNNRRGNWQQRMTELMNDPKFVEATTTVQRSRIYQRYGDLFRELNLPADQLEALQSLLMERDNVRRDVMMSAMQNGLDPRNNRDELRTMEDQMRQEVDNNIKDKLGDSVYQAYENYNNTGRERNTVSQINNRLGSNTTLSDYQSKALMDQLTASNGELNDQVINNVSSILTADQIAAIKAVQEEQQAMSYIQQTAGWGGGRGGFDGGRGGPPGGP